MELAHSRQGEGPPLLLVHGLGGSRRIWAPVIELLTPEREVVAVDMPGFGESPALNGRAPTGLALGEALASFCAEIGWDRPHVGANSLGAWAGLEMARAGKAASVTGFSPAGLWRKVLGPRRYDIRPAASRLRRLVPVLMRSSRMRARVLATTVAHPERVPIADAVAIVEGWISARGYEAANHEMRSARIEDVEEIRVPVTIAWGERDRLVGPPRPERRPPGTRFIVLPDCGHTPTWDNPELVARILLEGSGG